MRDYRASTKAAAAGGRAAAHPTSGPSNKAARLHLVGQICQDGIAGLAHGVRGGTSITAGMQSSCAGIGSGREGLQALGFHARSTQKPGIALLSPPALPRDA